MPLWRCSREDFAPLLLIVLLPLVVAAPQLVGILHADPILYVGSIAQGIKPGFVAGVPFIDPNNGFQTQALGYRAAMDWLHGTVPWWNPYSGVGLPLAAEYQPAAFFPLTFLILLPHGMVWLQLSLQILSGLGTYALLRQLGLTRLAATTGGILYAFNGTLAWFAHGPASPVPFLPWLLLGIERARIKAQLQLPHGWRLVAVAMAMSLLAGFPETAYISGLLALAWAVLRGLQTPGERRVSYGLRIALGGIVGIAIAAPQIASFFHYLPLAHVGSHHDFSHAALPRESLLPSLIAPYVYGMIFAKFGDWPLLVPIWGSIGGYVTIVLLVTAAYGFWARRDALAWLLLAWITLALGKTFLIEPAVTLWNLVPGVAIAAFARYAQPSWELAIVILAMRGLDDLVRNGGPRRAAVIATTAVLVIALGAALAYGVTLWPNLKNSVPLRNGAVASAFWAIVSSIACLALIRRAKTPRMWRVLAAFLAVDAVVMAAIPTLANPRAGEVNRAAIDFLRANLGMQRFFSLGPISPNYGAYFGIASINHNYLPVSHRWVEYVQRHLDPAHDEGVVFNGRRPSAYGAVRENMREFERLGVKYVVTPVGVNPYHEHATVKLVYLDDELAIFQLPDPKPYFEASSPDCTVVPRDRLRVTVNCAAPATVVRRELFFPGWTAAVNGLPAQITEHEGLFQALALPAGRSEIRYRYAPPRIEWAWAAMFAALLVLAAGTFMGAGRARPWAIARRPRDSA
jgi:hypothetical protein